MTTFSSEVNPDEWVRWSKTDIATQLLNHSIPGPVEGSRIITAKEFARMSAVLKTSDQERMIRFAENILLHRINEVLDLTDKYRAEGTLAPIEFFDRLTEIVTREVS